MNLVVRKNLIPLDMQPFEIVERKGIGHPDTIADGIAESISIEYSKYCLERFGAILHHNVDKTIILGGQCDLEYGKGALLKPFCILFGGRMSRSFGGQIIDIETIQAEAAKNYLRKILPRLNIDKDLELHTFTSSSSRIPYWFNPRTLDDLPEYEEPRANDTATVVGFWPFSTSEQIVLASEEFFYEYNPQISPHFNFVGSDIKLMALRKEQNIELTLCVPFHADKVKNQKAYFNFKSSVENELRQFLEDKFGGQLRISLQINTQDQKIKTDTDDGRGRYLTVIGSALDYGEEGVSGRGNRCRGLTSSIRTSTVESVYGKNPVYHVGKVYAYIANTIAQKIGSSLNCEATVIITTRNGDPLYSPYNIIVEISKEADQKAIQSIVEDQLQKRNWTDHIVAEGIFLPTNELHYEK